MISGFLFLKNGSRFEKNYNAEKIGERGCTFRAPYLLMRVTFPSSLLGFTTTPKSIYIYNKDI